MFVDFMRHRAIFSLVKALGVIEFCIQLPRFTAFGELELHGYK